MIKKTCDAYTTLKSNLKAGNLGKPWSKRYRRAVEKPITFRPEGAQPYDDRMLSWQIPDRTVSIWTLSGRVKGVAFTASPEQLARLALYRKGESDLVARDGMWFLQATCEIPEAPLNTDPDGFLGIDLGIVNIATTSDGPVELFEQGRTIAPALDRLGAGASFGHPATQGDIEAAVLRLLE